LNASPHALPLLEVAGLEKRYGATPAVAGIDLHIAAGEFFSLLGPSGCGKTSLLRLIAGLEKPDSGHLSIAGVEVTDWPAHRRPVNTMFQSYALFPHMTVRENVAFGLRQETLRAPEIAARVGAMLDRMRISDLAKRRPHELSGGEKQRVALCRALVKRPKLLLLDEPLAALDRKLREHAREELVRLQREIGITFVMVTHDQEEALTMSSRIAVMQSGRILQVGAPRDIYERPNCRAVADFVGLANFFRGVIQADRDARPVFHCADLDLAIELEGGAPPRPGPAEIMIRPERLLIAATPAAIVGNAVSGVIGEIAYRGDSCLLRVDVGRGDSVLALRPGMELEAAFAVGQTIMLAVPPGAAVLLPQ
jgi:putrescine transport system ATP-binding protein